MMILVKKLLWLGWLALMLTLSPSASLSVQRPVSQEEQENPNDRINHDTRAKMEKERRESEWRKLKDDTDKLHLASGELKELVEKSNKDTLSIQILKKAEEAEKILKDIKRRAKDGF
jgi:hypothetical protein